MMAIRATLAALLLALSASPAWAQAGWTTSALIVAPHAAGSAATPLVVGENGEALIVSTWAGTQLRTAQYHPAGQTWSPAVTIAEGGALLVGPAAIDRDGNAVVVFSREDTPTHRYLYAVRFDGATRQWGAAARLSDAVAPGAPVTALGIGFPSGGGTTVVFAEAGVARVVRTTGPTAPWSAAQTLFAPLLAQVAAVEADGGVLLAGADFQAVRVVACPVAATCGPPIVVHSGSNGLLPTLTLARSRAGALALAWEDGGVLAAIRSPLGAWTSATTLSGPGGASHAGARVGIDDAGNVVAAWQRFQGSLVATGSFWIQARRFDAATSTWGPTHTATAQAIGGAALALDPAGNAVLAWRERAGPAMAVQAARFRADRGEWEAASSLPTLGDTADDPAAGSDAAGNAIIAWRASLGAIAATLHARWRATPPAPAITAVAAASGALQLSFALPPTIEPAFAPTTLEVSVDGGFTWTPRAPAGLDSPVTIAGLTDGVLYVPRLRAVNGAGPGEPTRLPPLLARSGTATTPTHLRVVSRAGNTMTFAWVPPAAGVVPDGYLVEGSIAGQTQILASLPTGGSGTQITLAVPNGTFDVRVVAVAGGLRLGQSAPLQIAVNTVAFPSAPRNLLASAAGDTLALSWTNTWEGASLTGLQLLVSGPVSATLTLPVTESFVYAGVPPGTYTFAVTALNGGAPGGATSAVQLTFPGTCAGAPEPPTAFSLSTQGGRVFVDWLPPASGAAVTSYVLDVSGAFTGALPTTSRSLAVPVGAGSYSVRVAAAGPCGTSAFTAPQTVVVP